MGFEPMSERWQRPILNQTKLMPHMPAVGLGPTAT